MSSTEGLPKSGAPYFQSSKASEKKITHQEGVTNGKPVSRLHLIEGDPVFNIAAKQLSGPKKPSLLKSLVNHFTHVKVKTKEGSFSLNVRSTAKRLGITPDEVKQIAKEGNTAIATLQDKAKVRQKALEKYEGIAAKYSKEKGKLTSKEGDIKTGLKPSTLLKAIQKGMTIEDHNVVFRDQQIEVGKHTFFATKDLGKLHFVQKRLGAGTYGTVFKTVEMANAQAKALKVTSMEEHAIGDLKNENTVLTKLNKGGPHEGIPPTPSEITHISDKGIKMGFLDMTLMSGDLHTGSSPMHQFQFMPASERLGLCGQLINGLVHMHGLPHEEDEGKGYRHGDIKPENCLAQSGPDGKPTKFFLGDHGGTSSGIPETSTKDYRPSDRQKTEESADKGDVFALAKTLAEILGGGGSSIYAFPKPPEPIDKDSGLGKEIIDHLSGTCGIPKSVAEVLVKAMGPESERPTASEFKEAYDKAVLAMTTEEQAAKSKFVNIDELFG